jgi:hypothetical protein
VFSLDEVSDALGDAMLDHKVQVPLPDGLGANSPMSETFLDGAIRLLRCRALGVGD